MIGPLPEDIAQANMLEQGSALLLRAIHDHFDRRAHGLPPRPFPNTRFRWSLSMQQTADPYSGNSIRKAEIMARLARKDATAERRRTHRDPCFRCGTRADVGCSHQ